MVPVSLSAFTTSVTSGFMPTCSRVLPMPRKAKAIRYPVKLSPVRTGISMATMLRMKLASTTFLRPKRFIRKPVGMLNRKNQMKQDTEMRLTMESLMPRSSLT